MNCKQCGKVTNNGTNSVQKNVGWFGLKNIIILKKIGNALKDRMKQC